MKYLWWKDSDLFKEVKNYQMCSHICGGASSPSCSNYGLRRTVINNKESFGNKKANILIKTFCVDDLLKSLANAEEATTLLVKICTVGEFETTEFI